MEPKFKVGDRVQIKCGKCSSYDVGFANISYSEVDSLSAKEYMEKKELSSIEMLICNECGEIPGAFITNEQE